MRVALPLAGLLLALGCTPEIGDECASNVDCSVNGDRICDTTAPGGYCTVLECRDGTCPEESVCVAWGRDVSRRSFCMRHCASDGDCRSGYQCFDPAAYAADHADEPDFDPTTFGVILDLSPRGSLFCTRDF